MRSNRERRSPFATATERFARPRRAPASSLRSACAVALALALAATASACGARASERASVVVYAAASLADVLPEVARAWEADGGVPVRFSFAATSRLATQVLEGAPADAIVCADATWMDALVAGGRVEAGSRAIVATNTLVVVVPRGAASAPRTPSDLARAPRRLALAGEAVPAGRYARAALESEGVWGTVASRVVRADDVRLALRWVATGEADAGVVYRTDAAAEPRVEVAFAFAPTAHPPIVYPAAVVAGSPRAAPVARFLAFCRGVAGRRALERRGFAPYAP